MKTQFRNIKSKSRVALAVGLSAALTASLVGAQEAAPPRAAPAAAGAPDSPPDSPRDGPRDSQQGQIVIPQNMQMFGKNDPNNRKATAVVNGDIITGTDVDQRLALIISTAEAKPSAEEVQRLRMQVLRNLIDETLQIQEAKAAEIEISDDEIDQTYARVAQQNMRATDPKAMDAYLTKIGSSSASLKRQIKGELSWQRLLRRNVQPFINVSDEEVKEMLDRLKAAKGTDEYRIGEIYLASTPANQQTVQDNARRIVEQLRQGGSFVAYARQYSEASTAAVGGDLGWIRLAQLPQELGDAARELTPGQLVGPIQIRGGYSILYLIDKRQVLTADPRDAVLALKQISINFPKGLSQAEATKRAGAFATAMKQARGCGAVDAVAQQQGAQVVANDQVRARDLPGPLQEALLSLSVGETSPPFGSIEDGVRVLMLCGRDDPQSAEGPNFDQLMSQMEDDRVNKRAQMYLRDLRRDAIIDYN